MTSPADTAAPARDIRLAPRLLEVVQAYSGPPVTIMEVCGTHTVAIARMGLRPLLPPEISLLSGPGCPVCVTPVGVFDEAIHLAGREDVVLATFGDAVRVPGSATTLAEVKARGADVRIVYSSMDALQIALDEPRRTVVFFGIGFETTSPTVAAALAAARARGADNFLVLSAHKALLPAMEVLAADPEIRVGAYLCPGHASMVLGLQGYQGLVDRHGVPCVVAGFEPNDVLLGLVRILRQLTGGQVRVENAYPRAVAAQGNPAALRLIATTFDRVASRWRGLGELPASGYELGEAFAAHDARRKLLDGHRFPDAEPPGCRCAEVLRGTLRPAACPLFGKRCRPEAPVGACMVSSEGACGAHYRFREVTSP